MKATRMELAGLAQEAVTLADRLSQVNEHLCSNAPPEARVFRQVRKLEQAALFLTRAAREIDGTVELILRDEAKAELKLL